VYIKFFCSGTFIKINWQQLSALLSSAFDRLNIREFRCETYPAIHSEHTRTHWHRDNKNNIDGFSESLIINADSNWGEFQFIFFDNYLRSDRYIEIKVDCANKKIDLIMSLDDNYEPQKIYNQIKNMIEFKDLREDISQYFRKELDQKSGILLSARQAEQDFALFSLLAKKEDCPIGVLFFDIDGFKKLNSRYGETKIDKTILKDAQYLVKKIGETRGSAARYGGDEFAILLFNYDKEEIGLFAERLRKEFEVMSFKVNGQEEKVTISIGCAIYPKDGDVYEKVIEAANEAEHIAKQKGGNRVEFSG